MLFRKTIKAEITSSKEKEKAGTAATSKKKDSYDAEDEDDTGEEDTRASSGEDNEDSDVEKDENESQDGSFVSDGDDDEEDDHVPEMQVRRSKRTNVLLKTPSPRKTRNIKHSSQFFLHEIEQH